MQAIETRYIGPTNTKGARVKARAQAGSITLHWNHGLNNDQNHTAAAKALATKLGWHGTWIGGGLPEGKGNCFVCVAFDYAVGDFVVEKAAA